MEVVWLASGDVDRAQWNALLNSSSQKSPFVEPWFLDVVTNKAWSALVVQVGAKYVGAMPLFSEKKMGFTLSRQPIFSKYWGIISLSQEMGYKALHDAKHVTQLLLAECERRFSLVDYQVSPTMVYPQQAIWHQFSLIPMFTYCLELTDMDWMRKGYSKTVRKRIKKAQPQFVFNQENEMLTVLEALDLTRKAGKNIVDERFDGLLIKIGETALKNGIGNIFSLRTEEGDLACSGLLLHDAEKVYFLSGYTVPTYRQDGVMALWLDHVFEYYHSSHSVFDFMGSSVESIEAFFRSFGAHPKTYFRMRKARFPFNLK